MNPTNILSTLSTFLPQLVTFLPTTTAVEDGPQTTAEEEAAKNKPTMSPDEATADLTQRALAAMPQDDRLAAAASASQAAASANSLASTLRSKASILTDPAERSRLMQAAYDKELEAHGNSKRARVLTSGTFQGAAGGAGIGTAVGMGLGTVTGTLVGVVATVPGGIHGPWIKLGGKGKGAGKEEEKIPAEAVENGSVVVHSKTGKVKVVDEEGLKRARERAEKMEKPGEGGAGNGEVKKERKKPKKLEVRSKPETQA
jgi:hypothetical protein